MKAALNFIFIALLLFILCCNMRENNFQMDVFSANSFIGNIYAHFMPNLWSCRSLIISEKCIHMEWGEMTNAPVKWHLHIKLKPQIHKKLTSKICMHIR